MRIRKLPISLAISLLLLFAQLGALVHEINHLQPTAGVQATPQPSTLAEKTCELCLAYSQIATPAGHTGHVPLLETAARISGFYDPSSVITTDAPRPRNRGPPFLS